MPSASSTTVNCSEVKNLMMRLSMSGHGFDETNERILLRRHCAGIAAEFEEPITAIAGNDGRDEASVVVRHVNQLGLRTGRVKSRHHFCHFGIVCVFQPDLSTPPVHIRQQ